MVVEVNLIEQLGGYDEAKKKYTERPFELAWSDIGDALLEYRREHGIFERNDYVVNIDLKYSGELNIVSSSNDKALWFFGKTYGGFVKSQFRHATPAEIAAGKRLN